MSNVVLITGASSGIGKSIGIHLTNKGYKVYGTARKPENYPNHTEFPLLALDVTDMKSIRVCVSELRELEGRIDVLINNAGMGITGALEETPFEEIDRVMDTNFKGPMRVIQAVVPVMRSNESGLIINITSVAGFMGLPYRGVYSASKAAFEMISETYSMELKSFGIKVCSLAPGDFETNIAAGRFHTEVNEKSPYHPQYQDVLQQMNDHVKSGKDPIAVALTVEKIIKAKNPKVHYVVGSFLQKLSLTLKKILPSKMYERMLMNHYKI
jgi:NAD(P)-dependent dehydrogenase (short-subunit alcohol dehydrogenase family)